MIRKIIATLALSALLPACSQPVKTGDKTASSIDSTAAKPDGLPAAENSGFDYKHTAFAIDFSDTAWAMFSSDTADDRFTLFVPKGPITQTKTTLRITTKQGRLIYEHIFATSQLVNGYAIDSIKSDAEMEKYVLSKAEEILRDGLVNPKKLANDAYLNQAAKEDFLDYDAFVKAKKAHRILFHYCLQEESHYYLVYSDKEGKAVSVIECC